MPPRTHGERLPGELMALLDRSRRRLPATSIASPSRAGPGSFTGLRDRHRDDAGPGPGATGWSTPSAARRLAHDAARAADADAGTIDRRLDGRASRRSVRRAATASSRRRRTTPAMPTAPARRRVLDVLDPATASRRAAGAGLGRRRRRPVIVIGDGVPRTTRCWPSRFGPDAALRGPGRWRARSPRSPRRHPGAPSRPHAVVPDLRPAAGRRAGARPRRVRPTA